MAKHKDEGTGTRRESNRSRPWAGKLGKIYVEYTSLLCRITKLY